MRVERVVPRPMGDLCQSFDVRNQAPRVSDGLQGYGANRLMCTPPYPQVLPYLPPPHTHPTPNPTPSTHLAVDCLGFVSNGSLDGSIIVVWTECALQG